MISEQKVTAQKSFLNKLQSVLPVNTSLVSELADILDVSTDSAYRRMRGETALTIDEVVTLCTHFNISFDSLNEQNNGSVTFSYNQLKNNSKDFFVYMEYVLKDLKAVHEATNRRIIYACEDIPIFHNFNYPSLAAFKMFYWMKSILNTPELQGELFDTTKIPESIPSTGKDLFNHYANIPSIEIWTETTIQSTIKQIEFYFDAGIFKTDQDALNICQALRQEITDIQSQAEASHKFINGQPNEKEETKYTVYFSEIEITNNCVLIDMGEIQSVYLGHFTFNTMKTNNKVYCKETEDWLNTIIKKSTLISGIAEKQRYQFFKKAFKSIDMLEQKIENS